MNNITITDVAEALGVSKTTVSRAISGKGRIGAQTKERIFAYIEEHGYVPNAVAKGLAQSKTYNIAITLPEENVLNDLPFFKTCLMGVCRQAGAADYDVLISVTSSDDIRHLERMVNNHKVDGVILSRTLTKDMPAEFLKKNRIPFVAIGSSEDGDIIQVDHDHEAACKELTMLMLNRGFNRLALLYGDERHVVTQKRLKGFNDALEACAIAEDSERICRICQEQITERTLEELVQNGCECFICMDDSICVNVLDGLRRKHISVPEQVSVASFYNSMLLERNTPSVTALQFDAQELGKTACRLLLDLIEGYRIPKKTLLGYEISMKDSTRKPL